MSAQTVVILGGGVGGLVAANELAARLPSPHRIVLVERSAVHAFAPSFLWLMTGARQASQVTRDLSTLVRPRVESVRAEVRSIDVSARRVETDGQAIAYDQLVIALGAELAPEAIPGLAEGAHTFYTLDGAARLHEALAAFTGGSVAVVVSALPYKCPGAPHEGAMLLGDYFRRRGLCGKVELHLFTPEPQAMPVAGPELGAAVDGLLRSRGIAFHPSHKLTAVNPGTRELAFEGKPSARYDLLVAIPPHRGPRVIREAGLANDAGWVAVDRRTLATGREGVHAIGDVTAIPVPGRWKPDVPLMLPKAGVFAHDQARVVARRIASAITGARAEEDFCGDGYCMLEAGEDLACFAFGNFFSEPSPDVRLRRIGKAWHLGKVLFEQWWLAPFGLRRRALQLALEWGRGLTVSGSRSDPVPGARMSEDAIYLDHNATTPVLPDVVDAMLPFLRDHFGNPSSGHALGRVAHAAVERARAQDAALIGAQADEIVFTSGGTEANNLAIRGVAEARPDRRHVVTSVIEHPAVAGPCAWLERHGWRITRVGVDGDGRAVVGEAIAAIGSETALVTIMHANNETGALQPIAPVAEAARKAGAVVHADGAQSAGKVPVDVVALDVDLFTIVGHKLYAPKGVGALHVRRGTPLLPFTLGAGHERGLRPGTENVASIVGLGVACERARLDLAAESARVRALRDLLWSELREGISGLALNGTAKERLPNTLSVRFPGVSGPALLAAAPVVAASTGSACHAGREEPPSVVVAMGVPPREALGTVRLTLGRGTSEAEVRRAARLLTETWRALAPR